VEPREHISAGDRVFSIEDRPLGTVTGIIGDIFRMAGTDGIEGMLNASDIYTVEHHRVTMIFSSTSLREHQISRR
jgi:hypothetical protein